MSVVIIGGNDCCAFSFEFTFSAKKYSGSTYIGIKRKKIRTVKLMEEGGLYVRRIGNQTVRADFGGAKNR